MTPYLDILNDGPHIIRTNFFDSEFAEKGLFFLSTNEDCVRLLVPDSEQGMVKRYTQGTEHVILSRGPWVQRNGIDAIEILFEKHETRNPVIHMLSKDCDGLPGEPGVWSFAVWMRTGRKFECPLFFRKVDKIPCLLPLDYSNQPFVLPPVTDQPL